MLDVHAHERRQAPSAEPLRDDADEAAAERAPQTSASVRRERAIDSAIERPAPTPAPPAAPQHPPMTASTGRHERAPRLPRARRENESADSSGDDAGQAAANRSAGPSSCRECAPLAAVSVRPARAPWPQVLAAPRIGTGPASADIPACVAQQARARTRDGGECRGDAALPMFRARATARRLRADPLRRSRRPARA